MKRHTVILPLLLPRLSDRAAAQLLDVLHALLAAVELHYAGQAQCYYQRQQQLRMDRRYRQCPLSTTDDPPF
jgi:hypothetical protein